MSSPADPLLTTTFSDLRGPASNGHEDTEAAAAPGDAPVPGFGPPAVNGEVGTLGPYRVLKQLGRGGMGAVYLAKQRGLHREVAVKTLLGASVPRAMLARFWAEAEVSWGRRRTCGRWG